jgi:arylformamidase
MTTLFSALDWREMSQEARDLGLNNGVAVPGSVDMVAGWEQRSAGMGISICGMARASATGSIS